MPGRPVKEPVVERRRSVDPRIDEMERHIDEIEETVLAGKEAFINHEASNKILLENIQASLIEIQNKLVIAATYKDKVDDHERILRGNGKPGVVIQIDRLINAVDSFTRIGWVIVGVAVASGLGAIIAHFINPSLP